jgi:hypothetical protein
MNVTLYGYTFGFIEDPTAPNGWIIQAPPGPVVPVDSGLPPWSCYAVAGDGSNTVFGIYDLAPAATSTYQAASDYYLESIEGLAQNGDVAAYNAAYSALVAAAAPYNPGLAVWLQAGTSGYDTPVPLAPPVYAGLYDTSTATAWQTFVTAVYNIANTYYPTNVTTQAELLAVAYAAWYDVYIVQYDATVAAEAAYTASVAAYNVALSYYSVAEAYAVQQQLAYPYIVNGQQRANP